MPNESIPPRPPSGSFYDGAAATYDRLMADTAARRMRRRFLRSVVDLVRPTGPLLDFGCGTGVDARYYSSCGYRVAAIDTSEAMLAVLRRRCAGAIRAGRVLVSSGDLSDNLTPLQSFGPFQCVTANFAVFNHIDEPESVLASLSTLLVPGGMVVLSLLNPWYWRDMRQPWWWRSQWHSRGRPGLVVDLGTNRTVRHNPARIGRDAGLRRIAYRGALHGGLFDRIPGFAADPLVFVVLARQ